jgi:hypothetical protein
MAVISCVEIGGSSGGVDQNGVRNHKRKFRVKVDDPRTNRVDIMKAPGVRLTDAYPDDTDAQCVNYDYDSEDDDCMSWIVIVNYGMPKDGKSLEQIDNPLLEPLEISTDGILFQRAILFDANNKPIVNAAGERFEEPIEIDDSRPIVILRRNVANYSPSYSYQYRNAVNGTSFLGAAAKYVKVSKIAGNSAYHQKIGKYAVVTGEFHFNPEGWTRKLINQGYNERAYDEKANKWVLKPIKDGGVLRSTPALLDMQGKRLATGATPTTLEYQVYPILPFGPIQALFGVY